MFGWEVGPWYGIFDTCSEYWLIQKQESSHESREVSRQQHDESNECKVAKLQKEFGLQSTDDWIKILQYIHIGVLDSHQEELIYIIFRKMDDFYIIIVAEIIQIQKMKYYMKNQI